MKIASELIFGTSSLGLFGSANNRFALLPAGYNKEAGLGRIEAALGVKAVLANICESPLVGIFIASNSKCFLYPHTARLEIPDFRSAEITDRYTCLGNLVVANEKGALIAKGFSREAGKQIEEALGVPVSRGTIAGLEIVGSCAVANNNGVLVHPRITKHEIAVIESALKVKAEVGTLNRGSPYVGKCCLANDNGIVVGADTTPIEVTRLEDTLG